MLNHCQASREACHGPLCCLLDLRMREPPHISGRENKKRAKKYQNDSCFPLEDAPEVQKAFYPPGVESFSGYFRWIFAKNREKPVNHALRGDLARRS